MFTQSSLFNVKKKIDFVFPEVPQELRAKINMTLVDSKPYIHIMGPINYQEKQALAFFLRSNPVFVGLQSKELGVYGAMAIAMALKDERTQLAEIKVIGNYMNSTNTIGEEGGMAIGKALSENCTLTTLNLDINKIGDQGLKAIAQALNSNCSLLSLSLDCNHISNQGAWAIKSALRENNTLSKIYFGFTHDIDANLLLEIQSAVLSNRSELLADRNKISPGNTR